MLSFPFIAEVKKIKEVEEVKEVMVIGYPYLSDEIFTFLNELTITVTIIISDMSWPIFSYLHKDSEKIFQKTQSLHMKKQHKFKEIKTIFPNWYLSINSYNYQFLLNPDYTLQGYIGVNSVPEVVSYELYKLPQDVNTQRYGEDEERYGNRVFDTLHPQYETVIGCSLWSNGVIITLDVDHRDVMKHYHDIVEKYPDIRIKFDKKSGFRLL